MATVSAVSITVSCRIRVARGSNPLGFSGDRAIKAESWKFLLAGSATRREKKRLSYGEQTRQNADRVKRYWEVKANNLSAAGRSWGCIVSVESEGRDIFVIHAHRNGERFIVRADEILTAFLELERACANIAWSKK